MIRQLIMLAVLSVLTQGCLSSKWIGDSTKSVTIRRYGEIVSVNFYCATDGIYVKATSAKGKILFTGKYANKKHLAFLVDALRTPNLREGFITSEEMAIWMNNPGSPFYGSALEWKTASISRTASELTTEPLPLTCGIESLNTTSKVIGGYSRMVIGLPFTLAADIITCPAQLLVLAILEKHTH